MEGELLHLDVLDIDTLQKLYQKEVELLQSALIAGASWDSLKGQKNRVTELAIIIHRKKYPLHFNPAEFVSTRDRSNDRSENAND